MRVLVAAAVAGALTAPAGAWAADRRPDLDTSFAGTGVVYDYFAPGDEVVGMAVQPDGKILTLSSGDGKFNLVRRLANGDYDIPFGDWGVVRTDPDPASDWEAPTSVALLPDGRFAVGGWTSRDGHAVAVLVTYASDGSVQSTVFPELGDGVTSSQIMALAARPDGRLLIAFRSATADGGDAPVLARLLPDGTPDPTFGAGGVVRADVGTREFDLVTSLALAPDGKIVVAGSTAYWSTLPEPTGDIMLARFTESGALDPSFGTGGRVTRDITGPDGIDGGDDPVVMADGRIVMTVGTQLGDTHRTGLLRFLPNGRPDRTFDGDGLTLTSYDSMNSPVVAPTGGITVTGAESSDVLLAEFSADGRRQLWSKRTDIAGANERGNVLRAQPDGKLLVGGLSDNSSAVFRFTR
ncbi:NHL repeat-containing protein [Paractinoplanes deccanensis]|nr:hypothetical protein [Actinoplanes deccanensis]